MKKVQLVVVLGLLLLVLSGCGKETGGVAEESAVVVTDMAGRQVSLPRRIHKVYAASPVGCMVLYSLCPKLLVGQNNTPDTDGVRYIGEEYRQLPVLGSVVGEGKLANAEKVIQAAPDFIVLDKTVDDRLDNVAARAEELQSRLAIPVVVIDADLRQMEKTYRFLGALAGEPLQGNALADYCRDTLTAVGQAVAAVPAEKRVKVYYAQGPDGLATDPAGSRHTEVLDFVGGINVAATPAKMGAGQVRVSLEKVIEWNPDIIIAGYDRKAGESGGFQSVVARDAGWNHIRAVEQGLIFAIPHLPFNWFDRPPSVNRLLGVKWLAQLLYPEYVQLDIRQETKKFYQLFYHYRLSDAETEDVLKGAVRF